MELKQWIGLTSYETERRKEQLREFAEWILYLDQFELFYEGSESGKTLSSTATHSQQQGVSEGQPDDSADSGDVFYGIQEQHEIHGSVAHRVVRFQVLVHRFLKNWDISDLQKQRVNQL